MEITVVMRSHKETLGLIMVTTGVFDRRWAEIW